MSSTKILKPVRNIAFWPSLAALAALAALAVALVLGACQDNETAIARGDRLWADSSYDAALAEYRLAAAQHGDADALARLAHAYAREGQLDQARQAYDDVVADRPSLGDQAAYDFLAIAHRALRRRDDFGATSAVDAALSVRPALEVPSAVLTVARAYRDREDPERALAYYVRALTTLPPDSVPPVLYEMGLLEEGQDRCDVALDYYRAFRLQADGRRRWRALVGEARWHTGSCSFTLAGEERKRGEIDRALEHLDTMIGLGEPENLLDQAWFDRGEMLYATGRFPEALEAYRMVLERNPERTGQLVERAQARIDRIRFGAQPGDTTFPGGR